MANDDGAWNLSLAHEWREASNSRTVVWWLRGELSGELSGELLYGNLLAIVVDCRPVLPCRYELVYPQPGSVLWIMRESVERNHGRAAPAPMALIGWMETNNISLERHGSCPEGLAKGGQFDERLHYGPCDRRPRCRLQTVHKSSHDVQQVGRDICNV